MNRRTLAICDPEEAYACRLMDALSRREDFPFEVLAFTGAERLQDSLARKPVQILLIAQGLFREEGLGTACHFAAGGRKQPGTGASVREQVQQCAPDCKKSHGDGDANREIAIFADGREGLRVRILYAGRTQPADNACADDGTASGGK